jgi:hypothetical protein
MAHPAKSPRFYEIGIERLEAFIPTLPEAERLPHYEKLEHYRTELRWYQTGSRHTNGKGAQRIVSPAHIRPSFDATWLHAWLEVALPWLLVNGRCRRVRMKHDAPLETLASETRIRIIEGNKNTDRHYDVQFPDAEAKAYAVSFIQKANG